jgi:hypothetical protein
LGRRLPLNYRKLHWLVVAAHGDDRVAAQPRALDRLPPGQALWAGPFNSSRSDRYMDAHLTSNGIPITPALPGHTLDLGDGSRLEVIAVRQRGAILLLEWQNFQALLPVSASRKDFVWLDFGKDLGHVSVLSLGQAALHFSKEKGTSQLRGERSSLANSRQSSTSFISPTSAGTSVL